MQVRRIWAALIAAVLVGATLPASATLFSWSQTASTNSTADSTINWSEGQAPGTVNDSARAMMAAIAKYRDDLSGKLDTSGTSTAYTLTSNQTFTSLSDGIQIAFRLNEANGAAPTLNVDSLGAKPLRVASGADLAGAELTAGSIYTATYDAGGDEWLLNDPAVSAQQIPAGTVADFAGTTAPLGWLLMHGQCVSRTTYATLFAVLGTTYDNSCSGTEFGIPDARGRVVAGQDDMGGMSANRLTNQTGGLNGDTLGATGGAETHTLSVAELAAHSHASGTLDVGGSLGNPPNEFQDGTTTIDENPGGPDTSNVHLGNSAAAAPSITDLTVTGSTASTGSGSAHNNVQPTLILNKIIKY